MSSSLSPISHPAISMIDPQVGSLRASANRPVPAAIREAADGFEALFITQLLAPLEKSTESLFGDGPEGRMISGLFREQLSESVAAARPLGVARLIEAELLARSTGKETASSETDPSFAARAVEKYRKALP